jgi:FlaA1/EpsC-like NDP-sugar epimerase
MMSESDQTSVGFRLTSWILRHKYKLLVIIDALLWAIVLPIAAFTRFFDWSRVDQEGLAIAIFVAMGVQIAAGLATGLYLGRRKLGSFEEVGWVALTSVVVVVALFILIGLSPGPMNLIPRSTILAAGAYQIVGALAVRYVIRVLDEGRRRSTHERPHRLLVFGAGTAGEQAVRSLREDQQSDLEPVAFLDDDASKARLRLLGLPIAGNRGAIAAAAERYDAGALLIAVPSAGQANILDIADRGQQAGLAVKVLPRLDEFLLGTADVKDIRDITLADFLSREEVRLDLDRIAGYVEGRTVLVTGAGGSIGSELCATVQSFNPKRLVKLDHAENSLHSLQLRLEGRALLDSPDLVLADIRDRDAMFRIFETVQPEVVFHAAAHKHVTFLENHPAEAAKTNVFGTRNLLEAAAATNVSRFVNVSTDKAADPENVLGLTKRLGERMTSHFGSRGAGVYMSTRFGNVLGSHGSVIPTFREQIARGEPITVTDPEVTRYFMTIPEAVQLVMEAGAVGRSGDVLVLEMVEPVKIIDLAYRLAAEINPGVPPQITITGLREGEKLHETLSTGDDEALGQPHELLWRFRVPPLDPASVDVLSGVHDPDKLIAMLKQLVASELEPSPTVN